MAAPWIIGREALLDDALEDFLAKLTRQRPWLRTRYGALLQDLKGLLDRELGLTPLTALTPDRTAAWLAGLAPEKRLLAEEALQDFDTYLMEWAWIKDGA